MPQITTIPASTEHVRTQLRMAAYCRVSSNSADQLNSYAAQVRHYTEYIGAHPEWTLCDIYADEGLTGTEANKRDEFQRMLADCKRGKIDRILVKNVPRFARNTSDFLTAIRLLKSLGVTVLFEKEGIDTANMNGEFILTMHGMAAQDESLSISSNVRWATRRRMADGTFIAGSTPYGYRLQGRELVIFEPEAEIVRRIFAWYLGGQGIQSIMIRLNREHPEKRWYRAGIEYILSNAHYIGDALFQKKFSTGTLPYRKLINKGQLPQYYVEEYNVPIISAEDFHAVQCLREQRATQGYSHEGQHTLSGKLQCSCGSGFRRRIVGDMVKWDCKNHILGVANCPMQAFPETVIYNAFISMVNKLASHRKYILTPMLAQLEQMQSRHSGAQQKVYEIDRQIADLTAQCHTIARLHSKGILDAADFAAQTGRVNQQVNILRAERRKLLREDEENDCLAEVRVLDEALGNITETQTVFDEALFAEIVQGITMISPTELRFCLLGGLEFIETVQRQERR
ncbi:MAG: recombinase family protein [Firmicutes bacterium]|nr:recombinase family protein [Bacillota bacterium]